MQKRCNVGIVFENKKCELVTLNLMTSSIFACFPSDTQLWKKDGATETPNASDVIPVFARSEFEAITRKVPKSKTTNL